MAGAEKFCGGCKRWRAHRDFYKNAGKPDGLGMCKSCARASQRRYLALREEGGWRKKRFEALVELLERFRRREGHARVPSFHQEAGQALGRWVIRLRNERERLGRERRRALDKLDFVWDPFGDDFAAGLAAFRRYFRRERQGLVPIAHVEAGLPLGRWVMARRQDYRLGKLSKERIGALEAAAGWSWSAGGKSARQLEKECATAKRDARGLIALAAYARREGDAEVPLAHREARFALGEWVADKRRLAAQQRLAPALEAQLATLGLRFAPRPGRFTRGLDALMHFAAREGHLRVPFNHSETLPDGSTIHLGNWVVCRRRDYRRGRLRREREHALRAVPGWAFEVKGRTKRGALLSRAMPALLAYAAREGHTDVPFTFREDDFALGVFVSRSRVLKRKGQLPSEWLTALEAVPGGFLWSSQRKRRPRPASARRT